MKRFLILLFPLALWADYLFVFHDVGEKVALIPVVEELKSRGKEVEVIDLGSGDRYESLDKIDRKPPEVLIVGDASIKQLQYVHHFKGKSKIICYYDNLLEIDQIPYASLIRKFEKEVDLFLVPSEVAAKSSIARNVVIVGNPDLDFFEKKVKTFKEVPGRVAFFGGYGGDYEKAFLAFFKYYPRGIVYPHPKTDGSLEKGYGAQIGTTASLQGVGEAKIVVVHRSSIGIKAALAGKKVYSIESNGSMKEIVETRDSLGVPNDSVRRICDLL